MPEDEFEQVLVPVDTGIATLVRAGTRPGAWQLYVNGYPQSCVDLADPTHLEFDYIRQLGHVADLAAAPGAPLDALHLGGGAMTVPRYLAATRPGSRQEVVEIDAALAELVGRALPLDPSWRLDVHVGDGRAVLERTPADSLDLLVADAFTRDNAVPSHFVAAGFAAAAARALRHPGLFAMNVIDGPPLGVVRAQVLGMRTAFAEVCLIADLELAGARRDNVIVVASQHPLPLDELAARLTADASPAALVTGPDLDALVARGIP